MVPTLFSSSAAVKTKIKKSHKLDKIEKGIMKQL